MQNLLHQPVVALLFILLAVVNTEPPPTQYGPPPPSYTGETSAQAQVPPGKYGLPNFTPGQPLGDDGNGVGGRSGNCRNTDLKANEQLVRNFYQDELGDKRADLVDKYLAKDYINHNPFAEGYGGSQNFRQLLQGPLAGPSQKINFRRVDAVGDVVWTHISLVLSGETYAAMDIFRINCDGLIQEHWDVVQNVNQTQTRNPIAFF